MKFEPTAAFANKMDRLDPFKKNSALFHMPKIGKKNAIYFTGNSLGLQPIKAKQIILEDLADWATLGVEGHFHARRPWINYHRQSQRALAKIVGAKQSEVVSMNQLTINLHLMLTSFFRPTKTRYKIITESGAFSSDQYALESHLALHGLGPDAIIEIAPKPGEHTLQTSDILETIRNQSGTVALVLFGGIQYYSGQFFDIKAITEAAHEAGAIAGFDLAHAAGNVPLQLHNDDVDFAVWCSYKYLNAGPGAIAGAFVHEKHGNNPSLIRLAGWWGHNSEERFKMKKGFIPMPGAEGWQVSNYPILAGAAQLASLEIFERAGMKALRAKSITLTGYAEYLLNNFKSGDFTIITPSDPRQRGCQLSILMQKNGLKVFKAISKEGVIADWREPNVIRIAPAPLYNSFTDVYRFAQIFGNHIDRQ